MKAKQFKNLEHFGPNENWGDLEKVQWFHVHHLYLIRKELKRMGSDWPMIIHFCFETSGHATNSLHYKGMATDLHFDVSDKLLAQYNKLIQAVDNLALGDFLSIGAYPEWKPAPGGFHIDSRGHAIRWVKVRGDYVYGNEQKIREILLQERGLA